MVGLHGGDHPQAPEARDVGGGQVLRVLNAETPVAAPAGLLVHVQDQVIGLVADSVDGDLQAGLVGPHDVLPHAALRYHLAGRKPCGSGRIQVRREEQRRGGTQGAVGKAFQDPHPELLIAGGGHPPPGDQGPGAVDAHREIAALSQLVIKSIHPGRGRHVLHAGDAVARGIAQAGAYGFEGLFFSRGGNQARNRPHGRVFEHSRGLAGGIAHDSAARRVRRGAGDARHLQGERVRQGHVAVQAAHQDRMVSGYRIDQLSRGQIGRLPVLVIPLAPGDPAPLGQPGGIGGHAVAELCLGARGAQLDAGKLAAPLVEVQVGIVETGHHQLAAQVYCFCRRTGQAADSGGGANRHNTASAAGDGLDSRLGGIDGPDLPVDQDQVGGLRRQ